MQTDTTLTHAQAAVLDILMHDEVSHVTYTRRGAFSFAWVDLDSVTRFIDVPAGVRLTPDTFAELRDLGYVRIYTATNPFGRYLLHVVIITRAGKAAWFDHERGA